jgi:hypothetical protein
MGSRRFENGERGHRSIHETFPPRGDLSFFPPVADFDKIRPLYNDSRYDRWHSLRRGSVLVTGGYNLRVLREKLGLTMRDIETASEEIARRRHNEEYYPFQSAAFLISKPKV